MNTFDNKGDTEETLWFRPALPDREDQDPESKKDSHR